MSLPALALTLVRALPLSPAVLLSRFTLVCFLASRPAYRREIADNARMLCGIRSPWFWLRNGWCVGRNLALMARADRQAGTAMVDRAVVHGENIVLLERELHAVMVSFHYGLWELLPRVFARLGYEVSVAAGRQQDQGLDRVLARVRQDPGVRYSEGGEPVRLALRRRGLVGFMLDNTSRGRRVWSDCKTCSFGVPGLPFRLARRQGQSALPLFASLLRGRLRVWVHPPGDASAACRALLAHLQSRPEEWVFWGKAGALAPVP